MPQSPDPAHALVDVAAGEKDGESLRRERKKRHGDDAPDSPAGGDDWDSRGSSCCYESGCHSSLQVILPNTRRERGLVSNDVIARDDEHDAVAAAGG